MGFSLQCRKEVLLSELRGPGLALAAAVGGLLSDLSYIRGPGLTLAAAVGGIPPTNEGPSNSTFVPCRNETLFARLPPTIFGLHDGIQILDQIIYIKNLVCNGINNWLLQKVNNRENCTKQSKVRITRT
jgi:hypothetical protein